MNIAHRPERAAEPAATERMREVWLAVETARAIIDQDYAKDLTMLEVAGLVSLTPFQLLRGFRARYADTPGGYLRAVRIDVAKRLLSTTNLPVNEIGRRCGYRSHGSFSDRFRIVVGMSPSEFRHQLEHPD
jgi:AraC-like DNA-binding protein